MFIRAIKSYLLANLQLTLQVLTIGFYWRNTHSIVT